MDKTKTSIDHRELLRKSFDKIRINNPFDYDIITKWDGFPHIIPHNGYAIKERYIAEKYLEEVAKKIIIEGADEALKVENQRRIDRGMSKMNRYQEQPAFESDLYANFPQRIIQVIKQYGLYGGIIEEYGLDYVPEIQKPNILEDPNIGIIEQLGTLQEEAVSNQGAMPNQGATNIPTIAETPPESQPSVESASIIDDLEGKSQPELRSIAKQKGIITQNTDKKADLIAVITA